MSRLNYSPSAGNTIVDKLKVYEGGTGETSAAAARTSLDLIANSSLNMPNGVAGLDADSKLLPSQIGDDGPSPISVFGPKTVTLNTSNVYEITNFDIFTDYMLEVIGGGNISRQGNKIVYVPTGAVGAGGFKINGRMCSVTVTIVRPEKPSLMVTDRFGGSARAVLQCSGSLFSMTGAPLVHSQSDWQVATDTAFTNIVTQSMQDRSNLIGWTSGPVDLAVTFYIRVRYYNGTNIPSPWSDTVAFRTKSNYVVSSEEFNPTPGDAVSGNHFGGTVVVSGDGNRVIFGARFQVQSNNGFGTAYVYFRDSNGLWSLEQKLQPTDLANDNFGCSLGIDETGTRAVVGAYEKSGGGAAYVFIRNGSTWTQEAKLLGAGTVNGDNFGAVASMSADGVRVALGARLMGGMGAAFIFVRNGTTWTQEQKLVSADLATGDQFGSAVSIDGTGQRCVVAAYQKNNRAGAIYVFLRGGNGSWVQEAKLLSSVNAAEDQLGWSVLISRQGDRLISGAPGTKTATGAAYVFRRVNNAWGQEAKLEIAGGPTNMNFGAVVSMDYAGDMVVISEEFGSGKDGSTATKPGNAYIYTRLNNLWSLEKKIAAAVDGSNARYGIGNAVAGYGNRVAVGAYAAGSFYPQSGTGYIYS